ncbi:F-box protein At5g49610-like [Cucumis sativus]|uniref:F-box protein At5g49610-like n=1 Tax=Cucumis sativus TaxID=3659 RepID=UPI0012F4B791|nr:F-box protein At5g49610-like [Cucumis sativus]KAE8651024.1 hypothetical protein Csa_002299 [Cucumis sativus]
MVIVYDIVIHILSKLPSESLLRFKSVCRSWYALINHHKFVTKHLLNSFSHKHVLLKRVIINNSGKKEHVLSILEFSLDRSVSSVLDVPLPFNENPPNVPLPFRENLPDLQINGHSHGLICIGCDNNRDIFLCNPMTRQVRKLPSTSIFVVHEPHDVYLKPRIVGFGYDVKCGDFKVVRVVGFSRGVVYYPSRVEIYDLRKDRWREIKTFVDACSICMSSFDIYHEGTFYWMGINGLSEEEVILTFNMSREVFEKISIPESFHLSNYTEDYRSLVVLNGFLRIFSYPAFQRNEKAFEIWETEMDGSNVVSWSKLWTIGPLFGIEYPLLFLSSNELLIEAKEGQIILYDCKTQQVKELQVRSEAICEGDTSNRFEGTNLFVKSLISVEGGYNLSYEL